MRDFFVTGTSTEVGKTWVSRALLLAARSRGLTTLALKPVAAGCELTREGLRNEDALQLQSAMSLPLAYEQVNPLALREAIAPHIAAEHEGRSLTAEQLVTHCRRELKQPHDFALIEGAGGWRVPLNSRESLADLALALQMPVILVVGMGLGCLNHALLTAEAIQRDGLQLAGWVANSTGPSMNCLQENLDYLDSALAAPCLGVLPFEKHGDPTSAAARLELGPLLGG